MIDIGIQISEKILALTQKRVNRTLTPQNYRSWAKILLEEAKRSARGLTKSKGRWEKNFATPLADTFNVTRIERNYIEVASRRVYAGVHEGNPGTVNSYITSTGKWMTVPVPGTNFPRASELLASGKGFFLRRSKRGGAQRGKNVIFVREGNTIKPAYYLKRRVKIPAQRYASEAAERAFLRIRDRIDTYIQNMTQFSSEYQPGRK